MTQERIGYDSLANSSGGLANNAKRHAHSPMDRPKPMFPLRLAIFTLGLLTGTTTLRADTVTIDGDDPRERVTVTIRNSPIGGVLREFSNSYGFEVVRPEVIEQGEFLSVTMTGSLEDILRRLLRNMNHVIVRSPDNPSGIEKVILFGESTPALQSRDAAPHEPSPRDAHRQYSAQQGRD